MDKLKVKLCYTRRHTLHCKVNRIVSLRKSFTLTFSGQEIPLCVLSILRLPCDPWDMVGLITEGRS